MGPGHSCTPEAGSGRKRLVPAGVGGAGSGRRPLAPAAAGVLHRPPALAAAEPRRSIPPEPRGFAEVRASQRERTPQTSSRTIHRVKEGYCVHVQRAQKAGRQRAQKASRIVRLLSYECPTGVGTGKLKRQLQRQTGRYTKQPT